MLATKGSELVLDVRQVTELTKGKWLHGEPASWGRLQFDSRNLMPGDVFLALSGKRDGHAFIADAMKAGAIAAVVEQEVACDLPQLVVSNTLEALHELASWQRSRSKCELVMITGSNGKSTTKEMLASILESWCGKDKMLASHGNYNNHIGMPLCLLDLHGRHEYAVLEAGMNHPGEIAKLAKIAKPDLGIITNAGRAHVGNFANELGVAKAKGELIEGLPKNGIIVLNADDPHFELWKEMAGKLEVITFSHAGLPEATCRRMQDRDFYFSFNGTQTLHEISLQISGVHNEMNALAAAAAAWRIGVPSDIIVEGLEEFGGVPGRQEVSLLRDMVLINDTYNSSPESFAVAVAMLASRPEPTKILVMGDMLELGDRSSQVHEDSVRDALAHGIDHLLGYGDQSRAAIAKIGAPAEAFTDKSDLVGRVRELALGRSAVLVKGSRGMNMDDVVRDLGS